MGRREEKRALTKQQILAAAADLFVQKGYDTTTLEDVTEKANVSKGTFYYNFQSKEDLVVELRRWALSGTVNQAEEAISQGHDPIRILERLLLERAMFTEKFPELSKVFFMMRFQQLFFREELPLSNGADQPKRRFRKVIYQLVCEAQKSELIRADLSPQEVAGMISACFLHAQGSWLASDRTASLVEKVHRWLHTLLDGVAIKGYRNRSSCCPVSDISVDFSFKF
jgi:AcrR family transcriptional regulator